MSLSYFGCQQPTPSLATAQIPSGEGSQLCNDVHFLAAREQEGRGIGTAGQARAGAMIENRFRSLGLQPASPDASFRQNFTCPATMPARTEPVLMFNVLAKRVGVRADECIVVGAHYDHLGFGGKGSVVPWSHAMHPGADDNASGVAAVLALARRVAEGPKPARTILFVLFAGEERGLLGSDWFVRHPPVELKHIVAMLNFDMVGRLRDERVYVGGEMTADGFIDVVRQAEQGTGLELKVFSLGGGGPSDHRAFSERRVPVLFFFTGLHGDYHTPRDVADAISYRGLEQIVQLAANCMHRLAEIRPPAYCDAHDADATVLTPCWLRSHARLGIEVNTDSEKPLRISRVDPGSPADLAGLKVDDQIMQVDTISVHSFQELSEPLNAAMPGDEFRLTIERDGKMLRIAAYVGKQKEPL